MVHYSVLLPQRDATDSVEQRLPQLCQVLDDLLLPYEIICIDDASTQPAEERLQELLARCAPLRVLRFDQPRGIAAALTAGLAAARGEIVIAMDARDPHATREVPQLVSRLSRHDLAAAHRQRSLVADCWHACLRAVRIFLRSPRHASREDLLWASKRAHLQGLTLARGSFRLIEALQARRGLRVCRVRVAEGLLPRGTTYEPSAFDRLAAWWFDGRYEPHLASELHRRGDNDGFAEPDPSLPRLDVPLPRPIPNPAVQPATQPAVKKPHDSA